MAVIGYYSMMEGYGVSGMADDIIAAGHTPVAMDTLSAAELSQVDALYVWNGSNQGYSAEFLNAMPQISAGVANGMNMVVYDRAIGVANPEAVLPGTDLTVVRHLSADADLTNAGEAALGGGPAAGVNDTSIDGGNYTTHGYVNAASLPAGAEVLMTTAGGNAAQAVGFMYDFGAGTVQFYGIPMDFYNENRQSWENLATNSLHVAGFCLAEGTRMLCAGGRRRVEDLAPGDLLWTADHGFQPLRHLLRQPGEERLLVLTQGRNRLTLSPQHRVLIASRRLELWTGSPEALVPARAFAGSAPEMAPRPVYNLLLDRHEILLAEGIAVESLLPTRRWDRALSRSAPLLLAALRKPKIGLRPCRMILRKGLARAIVMADLADGLSPLLGLEAFCPARSA